MTVNAGFSSRFRNVVARIGSDHEGERHTAADRAFALCGQNGISFLEAMDAAFGTSGGNEDLQEKIAELEDDNRRLAEAVEALNAQQHVIPDNAGKEMLQRLWSYPQVRLLWTLFVASCFLWGIPVLVQITPGGFTFYALKRFWDWIFGLATLLWFWDWAVAEFSRRGLGVTVIKGVVIVLGVLISVFGFYEDPPTGVGILLTVFLLTVTNGASWLLDRLQHSDNEWFEVIRSFFL